MRIRPFPIATLTLVALLPMLPIQGQVIHTVAGGGPPDNGVAASASIGADSPAVDANGNVYFSNGEAVFKLDTTEHLTRIAGQTVAGSFPLGANGNACPTAASIGDGGPATSAVLNAPGAVALDTAGNLYIADSFSCRVRVVNLQASSITVLGVVIAPGNIGTVAGSSTFGSGGDGGPATSAQLYEPNGVAVDSFGNLYIADTGNSRVRKVNTSGTITTVAGNGTRGCIGDGGAATSAELNAPVDLAADAAGNIYVADNGGCNIRVVSTEAKTVTVLGVTIAAGNIATVAGDGVNGYNGDSIPAISAELSFPRGVSLDSFGNLYIADTSNARIREVSTSGTISTVAGNGTAGSSGDGGPATSAEIAAPNGVALDAFGDIFIADAEDAANFVTDYRIRKVSPGGMISTVAGNGNANYSGDGQTATGAQFNYPDDVAVDAAGNLYIADSSNNVIRAVNTQSSTITLLGIPIAPGDIATVAGNEILHLSCSTNSTFCFGGDGGPATGALLNLPNGVALDGAGNLYIADSFNSRIRKVDTSGTISTVAGSNLIGDKNGSATGTALNNPVSLALDWEGNIYVSDDFGNVIRAVNTQSYPITLQGITIPAGNIATVAGTGTAGFTGDNGAATSAEISNPQGIALDAAGNLYFADSANSRVRRVDTSGTITTVAGSGTEGYSGDDGPATSAELIGPYGVTSDASGNLYIADASGYTASNDSAFRVVNNQACAIDVLGVTIAPGDIATVAGNGSEGFSGDGGLATSALLNYPTGAALDAAGDLYIADEDNLRIRRVDAPPSTEPDFTITTPTPTQQVSQAGNGATYLVTVSAVNGFSGIIAFSVMGNPAMGVSFPASVTIPSGGSQNIQVMLTSAASLGFGNFPLNLIGTTECGVVHSLKLELVVANSTAATPTVTVTPSPASITTTQALTVTVTVAGTPTPTGSVTLTSSSYSSGAVTLVGGAATINIPAGTLGKGSDTLTASYTPDSSSASAYTSATGTNTVTVTAASSGTAPDEWTWMGGSKTVATGGSVTGVYGTLGTPAATNIPGGRYLPATWTDSNGNFWLFGGEGGDANDTFGLLNDLWEFNPSTNEWTWVGGSNTVPDCSPIPQILCGESGVYGTLGTPAAANVPGGRYGAATWTDKSGNLWLFGGVAFDSAGNRDDLNDLWEFNPATKQWTWIGGVNTFVTGVGVPGVYGTKGTAAAGNIPGGRSSAASWVDNNGNFWLFGGGGYDSANTQGFLNDLWEFNPSSKQWTWVTGSKTEAVFLASYGTLGTPASGNTPGGRWQASQWKDNAGNLWLFGGEGFDGAQDFGVENDVWEFNISTGEWTWMGGSAIGGEPGIYGTLGLAAPKNIPGARAAALQWTDNQGHFWLLGGSGFDADENSTLLNDLWEFNPTTNEWTWTAGTSVVPSNRIVPGVYGMLGVAAAGNVPGGRQEAASWVDKTGNLWLFGGSATDSAGNFGNLNDVWEFEIASGSIMPTVTVSPTSASIAVNQPLNVTVSVGGGGSNPTPTGSVTLSSGSYSSAPATLSGGSATITIPANSLVVGSATLTATYTPDAASASTYSDAIGSNTVTVTGNPVPAISTSGNGVEPVVIQAGVGAITLTVTGTGFVPASVVDFNGNPRVTTFVSATQLTAQILASDVASIGTWPITVVNPPPGGGTSNAVTFNASLFAQTLTPGSLTFTSAVGVTTATQTATFTNVGNIEIFPVDVTLSEAPPKAFSIVANTCPNDLLGGASCTISIAFTPPTAGIFTATLVIPNGAYTNLNSTTLTGYGLNAAVTVVPSPSSIAATENLAVSVFVAGSAGNPTPTGSVTLTSGSYTSAPTTLSGGSAFILVPAGSLGNGTDTLTARYTPDAASASLYPSATGSNTVAVLAQAQSQLQWEWVSGSNTIGGSGGRPGVYGTLQTPAAANVPGGRNDGVGWTNSSGNLWLFGGSGLDANGDSGDLNDMWEFNPSTNQWTWISGSNAFILGYINGVTQNVPIDSVFGTMGVAAAGNTPGGRAGAVAWTDKSGNLWLFGGAGEQAAPFAGYEYTETGGQLNDLWEFNPSTNQWAWMGGSNLVNQSGVYGTLGTPAAGNIPGARANAVSWTDNNGNFWLFGGYGYDSAGTPGYLNDLWEYSTATKQWAWIAGSNTNPLNTSDPAHDGAFGVYGTQGTAAAGNTPGARIGATAQTDHNGNLWMFGGTGLDLNGTYGYLDDLWEFSPSTALWTWVGGTKKVPGSTNSGQPGIYGTFGVLGALNDAGGRTGAVSWNDKNGNLWLMGGQGYDSNDNLGGLNDVWAYQLSTDQGEWLGGNNALGCVAQLCAGEPGEYGMLRTAAIGNTPGGRNGAISWTDSSGRFWLFGGTGQDANNASGLLNDLWSVAPTALAAGATIAPTVTVTPSPGSITTAQGLTVTVTVSGTPTPTGSVTLSSGSYSSGAVTLSSGSATINIPAGSLATGTDTLTATYAPDSSSSSTYNSATGTNTVNVTSAATAPPVTVAPSPASITTAQALSVTITVSGTPTPTGSITLMSGTYSSGAVTLSGGAATVNIPAGTLVKGTDTLTANYTPDSSSASTYTSATGSNTVTVTTAALITPMVTVTPSPSSITSAQALTVAVTVGAGNGNPTPTGSVTLTSGTYSSGAVTLSAGSATINIPAGSLATSTDTLTATYTPDSASSTTYNSATGSNTVTVTASTVQVTVGTSPAGLSFSVDGTSYSSAQTLTWTVGANHTIATTTPQILAGTQESFSAWSDGGAQSHSVTASSTSTTYTASFTATAYQLTTAASPAADGTVIPASGTFYAPGTVVNLTATANSGFSFTNWTGSVASASSASTTVTMTAPESVTANFGSATVSAPGAALTPATLTFSGVSGVTSAAQDATLTNTGNATLNIAGITITGTNPADFAISTGSSACGTTLAAGANCLIYVTFTPASAATFSATLSVADNAAGSPQTTSLTGTGTAASAANFTLSSPTAPQTVQPGDAAQFTIIVTPQNGTFANPVTLSASGLPAGAVATFNPASVTPGSSSANSTLSIQTASASATAANRGSTWPFATSALAIIGLCLVPGRRRRRWISLAVLLIASLGAFTALTACGGGFGFTSPSQSYTITVAGTSGADVQTTTVQLTVQ